MAHAGRAGVYFCRQPSRCVAPLGAASGGAESGHHRFLVGTCTLQARNEIHSVDFCEDSVEVACKQVYEHDGEVWLLAASPSDGRHLLTYSPSSSGGPLAAGQGRSGGGLRLWKVPGESEPPELQLSSGFEVDDDAPLATVKSALWDMHHEGNTVVADQESLHVFQGQGTLGAAGSRFTRLTTLHVGQRCNGACLDPHHPQQVSTVDDAHLKTWDLRAGRVAFKRDGAHLFGARDVDYNPNAPYQVMTTGEDATLRFWDLRHLSKCRKSLVGGHHHWITRARYNGHHDQLILSCGTDSAVCLWRAGSVASAPIGNSEELDAVTVNKGPADDLIRRFEEHEDSCYGCCWSATDAWVFASVSFDGKLVINRVPDEEKYKILL